MEGAPPPQPTGSALATGSVASRFVSQTSLDEAKAKREADWKAAYERLGQEPPKEEKEEVYDGRSLWEKLQEHKDKKQEAFDEQLKFKNQFRALDEDEISFLDSLVDDNHEEEDRKQKAIQDELKGFRQAVAVRSAAPPPPALLAGALLSPTLAPSTSTAPSTSSSAPVVTAAAAPPKKKKKDDLQKKLLSGVIVKKKPKAGKAPPTSSVAPPATATGATAGIKRSAGEADAPAKAEEGKKRKVEGEGTKEGDEP